MPNAPRSPCIPLLGALACLALLAAAACGASLSSLARETFFAGYDCPKKQIKVTGGGDDEPYTASGCGKHAFYRCRDQNGGMGCEEVAADGGAVPAAPASGAPLASASPSSAAAPLLSTGPSVQP